MKLILSNGEKTENPSKHLLKQALADLTAEGACIKLHHTQREKLKVCYTAPQGYMLSYRESESRLWYACLHALTFEETQRITLWYLEGDENWKLTLPWQAQEPPSENLPESFWQTPLTVPVLGAVPLNMLLNMLTALLGLVACLSGFLWFGGTSLQPWLVLLGGILFIVSGIQLGQWIFQRQKQLPDIAPENTERIEG